VSENQATIFDADDGSVIRACDFGPEFGDERRYLALPALEPIVPADEPCVFVIEGRGLRLRSRGCRGRY